MSTPEVLHNTPQFIAPCYLHFHHWAPNIPPLCSEGFGTSSTKLPLPPPV